MNVEEAQNTNKRQCKHTKLQLIQVCSPGAKSTRCTSKDQSYLHRLSPDNLTRVRLIIKAAEERGINCPNWSKSDKTASFIHPPGGGGSDTCHLWLLCFTRTSPSKPNALHVNNSNSHANYPRTRPNIQLKINKTRRANITGPSDRGLPHVEKCTEDLARIYHARPSKNQQTTNETDPGNHLTLQGRPGVPWNIGMKYRNYSEISCMKYRNCCPMKAKNACHNVEQFEIFFILLRNKFWHFILQKKGDISLLNL